MKTSTPPQKCPPSLQCFSLTLLICLCASTLTLLICSGDRGFCQEARRCQSIEKRRTGATSFFSSPPPLLFRSFEFSPSYTVHLFSFLPPNHTLSSFHFKQKHRYLTLFFFFLCVSFSFNITLGRSSALGLWPTSTSHHPSHSVQEKYGQANKQRQPTARNHEMTSSRLSCMGMSWAWPWRVSTGLTL